MSSEQMTLQQKVLDILHEDAVKIRRLIEVQLENLTAPQCPVYEEVLDTQLFGLSREIDFAVRSGLLHAEVGRQILANLEKEVSKFHDYFQTRQQQASGV